MLVTRTRAKKHPSYMFDVILIARVKRYLYYSLHGLRFRVNYLGFILEYI
ncbi:hypothetical protein HanIR_Chr13g0617521 [Helianthus annuus]|nr:hypothetical protein HanIR_Chr13g0617521 [Helianthus annuus]